jgi:hypothetical protein
MSGDMKLEACPFCGGPAALRSMNGHHHAKAQCRVNGCGVQTPILTRESALAVWNTRALSLPTRDDVLEEAAKVALSHSNYGHVEGNKRAFVIVADLERRAAAIRALKGRG